MIPAPGPAEEEPRLEIEAAEVEALPRVVEADSAGAPRPPAPGNEGIPFREAGLPARIEDRSK